MNIPGIKFFKAVKKALTLSGIDDRGGWRSIIRDWYPGAWQNNEEITQMTALCNFAVYSCVTLISSDIGKMKPLLKKRTSAGIWEEVSSAAFSPVLRRPNRYQNIIQFIEWWIMSKLCYGNTYVLKEYDARNVVVALYILNPNLVQVMETNDGTIYYQLSPDKLSGLQETVLVPASSIIHDRMNCLFHPLVGVPPLYANAIAATSGIRMQKASATFFENGAQPGGILSAPGAIEDETAQRLKDYFSTNFTGAKAGNVAVLGDGLKFEPMQATAVDSQLVENLKLSAEIICSTYHVPSFKIGFGAIPAGQKIEDMNQIYYSDCLQSLIENLELCLDEGLALPDTYGIECDLEKLLRMDNSTLYRTLGQAIKDSLYTPNEARRKVNRPPITGGDTIYMQQQNFSLEALSKRDSQADPFAAPATPEPEVITEPVEVIESEADNEDSQKSAQIFALYFERELKQL